MGLETIATIVSTSVTQGRRIKAEHKAERDAKKAKELAAQEAARDQKTLFNRSGTLLTNEKEQTNLLGGNIDL